MYFFSILVVLLLYFLILNFLLFHVAFASVFLLSYFLIFRFLLLHVASFTPVILLSCSCYCLLLLFYFFIFPEPSIYMKHLLYLHNVRIRSTYKLSFLNLTYKITLDFLSISHNIIENS